MATNTSNSPDLVPFSSCLHTFLSYLHIVSLAFRNVVRLLFFTFHSSLNDLSHQFLPSQYVTNPVVLSPQYRTDQCPLFSYHLKYVFICSVLCPGNFFHFSPDPHFKRIKSSYILFPQCPRLCPIRYVLQFNKTI